MIDIDRESLEITVVGLDGFPKITYKFKSMHDLEMYIQTGNTDFIMKERKYE